MSEGEAKERGAGTEPPPRPCPICGKPSTQRFRPFCSRRCADVDLHRWLGGRYVIPVYDDDPDTGGEAGGPRDEHGRN
jgi:endogenous inhibitor of DNA gyrase (YacG/DUF329 family)